MKTRVFGICLRMLRDRDAALDATQETFVNVFRKADRFRAEAAFSTWLYRVAVNTCYDQIRKTKRHVGQPLPETLDPVDPGAGEPLDAVEVRPEIEQALQKLPAEFRAAVVLVDLRRSRSRNGGQPARRTRRYRQITGFSWPPGPRQRTREPQTGLQTSKERVTMHEHDHGLIMALTEAALGENDAAAAAAEIAGCIRCTEDLEMQRLALDATAGAPNIYLSATESARLRSGVHRELKLSPEAVKPARRRRFPVGALAGAAAVLIAVVIAHTWSQPAGKRPTQRRNELRRCSCTTRR